MYKLLLLTCIGLVCVMMITSLFGGGRKKEIHDLTQITLQLTIVMLLVTIIDKL